MINYIYIVVLREKKKQLCVLLLIHPFNLMVIAWNEVDIGQDCN